jgi:hypothetical protein
MESLYANLKSGVSKADFLLEARLPTMPRQIKSAVTGQQESLISPYFYAPFVLIAGWNRSCPRSSSRKASPHL